MESLAENFTDALINGNVGGDKYWKKLGSGVQQVMREATQFTCLYKPISGTLKDEKYLDTPSGEELTRTFITIKIELFQPGTNDKIVLERTFNKALLDTK